MRQTQWTVPENELREAVRLHAQEIILPAYRAFLKRHRYHANGSLVFKHVFFTVVVYPIVVFRALVRLTTKMRDICLSQSFPWHCSTILEGKQSVSKHLKYTPDDLEHMLNELFEGKSRHEPRAPGRVPSR